MPIVNVLDVLDHGANDQWCGRLPDRAALETWKVFSKVG